MGRCWGRVGGLSRWQSRLMSPWLFKEGTCHVVEQLAQRLVFCKGKKCFAAGQYEDSSLRSDACHARLLIANGNKAAKRLVWAEFGS